MAAILREGKIIAILSGPRSLGKARSDLYATIGFTTYQVVRRFASVIIAGEITTLGSRYTNHTLFDLPEYEQAFSTFTYAAIHELMNQKEPVLGSIKRVKMPVVPVVRNTLPSGQVVENEPVLVKSPFSFPVKDAISGNVESLLVAIDDAAEDGMVVVHGGRGFPGKQKTGKTVGKRCLTDTARPADDPAMRQLAAGEIAHQHRLGVFVAVKLGVIFGSEVRHE